MMMLFSVLLLLPSIAGFIDNTQMKGPSGYLNQRVVRLAEMPELIAQAVSKDIHERCLAAKDYSGCIQSNSGQSPGVPNQAQNSESILGRETCFDTGVCIAQPGQDQLGLPKIVGWFYSYNNYGNNTVVYWEPEAKRVPHKGQPARYIAIKFIEHYYQQPIAATPGYYREITPAKTTCTPTYSGGKFVNGIYQKNISGQTCTTSSPSKIWVAGTPATPGGPRKRSWVEVTDCQDMTYASYIQGKLKGNWSKHVGARAKATRKVCSGRENFKIKNMKL